MIVGVLLAFGTMLATPLAQALPVGVDASSVDDMSNAGAKPAYGQLWVGIWTKKTGGWSSFEDNLRSLRDQGVTPVVMWYYWGDSISVNAVKYGKDSRSKGDWDWMAKEMARRGNAVMGGKEWIVVMEPEFNKFGIQHWDTFDGYLADQAWSIRAAAPSAKIVTGFGHWGSWDLFDRAMGASHYSGFQWMRASTRDSSSSAEASADKMLEITRSLKSKFGKPVFMFDLAIGTYGGWEGVQERALQRIVAKLGDLEAAGMKGLVWRYVHDNSHSSGYYGAAESSWGVKYTWGGKKPAYDELVSLLRSGASTSASTTTTTTSVSVSTTTSSATAFTNVKGNNWWIQANVADNPTSVSARVNGGPSIAMSKQWWGAHTVSTHAPTGSTVELVAKYADGRTVTAAYKWPDATPVASSSSATAAPSGSFDAQFANVKGNEWWVQADVKGNEPISKVEVRVNGGSWVTLTKQWWGAYAVSTRAPAGSWVEVRATSTSGATDATGLTWLR